MAAHIAELQAAINAGIANISFPAEPSELYEPQRYVLSLGGKHLRPVLVLLGAELYGAKAELALKQALGIELFHTFTLVHDDIMDSAPLRRGQQTVHEKWNNNVGILSGDGLLIRAYQLMADTEPHLLPRILQLFSATAIEVCEGQQMDMDFEKRDDVSLEEYSEMIRLKTAVLLGASLAIGSICAGASEKQVQEVYSIGETLGIAFQIQDDYLDSFADQASFGKQKGGDIIEGKKTWLALKLRAAIGKDYPEIEAEWRKKFSKEELVGHVCEVYKSYGIDDAALAEIDRLSVLAQSKLSLIGGDPKAAQSIGMVIEKLKTRKV